MFTSLDAIAPIERWNDHGGRGVIFFRRVLEWSDFRTSIDFVDYTVIPAGSTIGRHEHHRNEEIYFIQGGYPLMVVDGQVRRMGPGSFAIVRDGGSHELINDTAEHVEILVMQVGMR
ncbi:MAG: cupin domain-containing protein [Acidobacteriaceae bacterium]|nr:cupin domain-containing protein [Acidobacteriaceae bacterium]